MNDKLEPIRRVFREAGLYHFAADDLLCQRLAEAVKPQAEPVASVAWQEGYRAGVNDERISEANIGIAGFGAKVEPNRNNPYAAPQPQASAEDVALVSDAFTYGLTEASIFAWRRIKASLGVAK